MEGFRRLLHGGMIASHYCAHKVAKGKYGHHQVEKLKAEVLRRVKEGVRVSRQQVAKANYQQR